MYSYEQRMTAVKLYIQYRYHAAVVIRELGYPSRHMLARWYKEYEEFEDLHKEISRPERCASLTIKEHGYPSQTLFKAWLNEAYPDREKRCVSGGAVVECPQETKEQAVITLCAREGTAKDVAKAYGVSTVSLYKWKKQLFGEEQSVVMPKKVLPVPETEAEVIDALRDKYRLKELLEALQISKSSYCYQEKCIHGPDKYADLRSQIQVVFRSNKGCYGYRRVHELLRRSGTVVSEKVVRRLMKKGNLTVRRTKCRKFSFYVGEISPTAENVINRNFHADVPNTKWLTDITEFSIPAGKVYLSPIIDCFDGLAVSWAIGTSPSADLANSMQERQYLSCKMINTP